MTEAMSGDARQAGRPMKAPNRKKFEEELDSFSLTVKQKEDELRSLDVRPQEKIQSDVRKLRYDREQKFHRRQSVDSDLRKISEDIRKQESELTKVQSNLQYRSEHKINEAIQRLETQLKTRNFRLNEEKKIVAEIDSLKRSTKDLTIYLALKKQIDEKRDQQRKMRDERDRLQKMVTEIKQREENVWQESCAKNEEAEHIKNEIGEVQQKMKELQITFSAQEREFRQQKEELRRKQAASIQHRKEEDRRAFEQAFKQELEEFEATRDPFAEEKLLCKTLIKYLQRFLLTDEEADKAANDVLSASHGSKLALLDQSLKAEGMFLLRRKSDAEEMQSARLTSKARKGKKRPSIKKIVHTPETFDQFSKLDMTAPASAAEVQTCIAQLKTKLADYETYFKDGLSSLCVVCPGLSPAVLANDSYKFSSESHNKDSVASSAASYTESAVSGSMPTTPDVQLDGNKTLQVVLCPRRLSRDSGTGDVDEQSANTIEPFSDVECENSPERDWERQHLGLYCGGDDILKEKQISDPNHLFEIHTPCSTITSSSSDVALVDTSFGPGAMLLSESGADDLAVNND